MRIGVPREVKTHEYRVGLVPGSVRELVHHGHEVLVETGGLPPEVAAEARRFFERRGPRGNGRGRKSSRASEPVWSRGVVAGELWKRSGFCLQTAVMASMGVRQRSALSYLAKSWAVPLREGLTL